MLTITIPGRDHFNEEDNTFSTVGEIVLELEHSLVSLSKWESKWQIPFLSKEAKTDEQLFDYVLMMIQTPGIGRDVLMKLAPEQITEIQEYIQSPESATTFYDPPGYKAGMQKETITAELIYYWMCAAAIPFECQYWHLNRLFALIRIHGIKSSGKTGPKLPPAEIARRNRELNEQRKAKLGTRG
jgi:hypothetical protein